MALVKFPFTSQIDYKIRPAVIISNLKFNKVHDFFWACPVTSKTSLKEFEIEITNSEFSGQLKTKSYIRSDTIVSMEKNLFLKEIGKISQELFEKLKQELLKNL